MTELLERAIEYVCHEHPTLERNKSYYKWLLRKGQYLDLYHKLSCYIYDSYWTEEEIIRILRLCGHQPILRRKENKFYWYVFHAGRECTVRPTDFTRTHILMFDQCIAQIQQRGYRDGMDNLQIPDELVEHIIYFT